MIAEKLIPFRKFGSKLGLERMKILLEKLGNPEKELKVIHIGGTNGKGSVSKYIYEGLLQNEYKVGLYTSPQIENFNERIQVNGKEIREEELENISYIVFLAVEEMKSEGQELPTEFELITAMAMLHFYKQKVDFAILEVGMGGIGDATNVIEKPIMTIINTISKDHMTYLGHTIEEIASEKAGIIKAGVPVVIGVEDIDAKKVIARKAYEKRAQLYDTSKLKYNIQEWDENGSRFSTVIEYTNYSDVELSMIGVHQIKNAIVALTAMEVLRQKGIISVERSRLYSGIKKSFQKCRMEFLKDSFNIPILLDGAHNTEGAVALRHSMNKLFSDKKIVTVLSVFDDKEIEKMAKEFASFTEKFLVIQTDNDRSLKAENIFQLLKNMDYQVEKVNYGRNFVHNILTEKMKGYDMVVFTGSLDFVGKVRKFLCSEMKQI